MLKQIISENTKRQKFDIVEINLDAPPIERWRCAENYKKEVQDLVACYWQEIEDYADMIKKYLGWYKLLFISNHYQKEIRGLAQYCDIEEDQLFIVNLYYDLIKFAFACTAFAVEQDNMIWHARNLDWWTDDGLLEKHTKIFDWKKGGKTVFQSVGWLGFIGVLSGMKPQAFSITLNAIISEEAPNVAKPVSFLLREVLEKTTDYQAAKKKLEKTKIVCDCLLLLTGVKPSEIAVIERTPRKSKTRYAEQGCIVVTNDYRTDIVTTNQDRNILTETSCGRYDRALSLLTQKTPESEQDCFKILDDGKVKMEITVQQMVFNAKEGNVFLKEVCSGQ